MTDDVRRVIEGLQAKIETLSTALAEKVNRIEELERIQIAHAEDEDALLKFLYDEGYRLSPSQPGIKWKFYGHRITTEQIDAAWRKKVFIPSACLDDSENTYIPITALGIVQCEECDGSGKIVLPLGNGEHPHTDCNGHGWVTDE
jgi:hypothetical protein